jgi:hypothetical protein
MAKVASSTQGEGYAISLQMSENCRVWWSPPRSYYQQQHGEKKKEQQGHNGE